ncbi:MAG TPA: hypothetical protein VFN88_04520 [Caulobacteraceae bacterium]|nr:hypothetical protein [Caulobacteraceae bacterium]
MPKSEQAGTSTRACLRPGRVVPAAFTGVALALACLCARAEEANPPPDPGAAIVDGLAPGDFLNIRATPSPIGQIEARLPNGAGVANHGCAQYGGYDWCKITTLDAPKVTGWTPGRYLRATGDDAPAPSPARTASNRPAPDLPDNLDARLGDNGGGDPAKADDEKLRDALIARYRPVYRAALGLPTAGQAAPAAQDPGPDPTPASGQPAANEVPHPTPRPDPKRGPAVASVQAAEKATGEVPCAGLFGQPMQECSAAVTRLGPGVAEVVVTLPAGGTRTIRFRGGKPDGSDSSEPLQVTREGSLNMIRIGKGERFEILDELALGK